MREEKKIQDLGIKHGEMIIFGGAYSNLESTNALFDIIDEKEISAENIISTGDICGYCADPLAVAQKMQERGIHGILGKSEAGLDAESGLEKNLSHSLLSDKGYEYAKSMLTPELTQWMTDFSDMVHFEYLEKKILVCHGSPDELAEYMYESVPIDYKKRMLDRIGADIVITGNTGIPYFQDVGGGKYWINVGAIGMPANNGGKRTWYLTLEEKEGRIAVKFHKLKYDYETAATKMKGAELSEEYIENIMTGLWPSIEMLPEHGAERRHTGHAIMAKKKLFFI